jgi:hypothetical protein
MDLVYGFVVGKYEPNWLVVDSSHHFVFPVIPFFSVGIFCFFCHSRRPLSPILWLSAHGIFLGHESDSQLFQ